MSSGARVRAFVRREGIALAVAVVLVSTLLISPVPSAHGQEEHDEQVDLVFLLDGSGSIDATDWQVQKQGLAAALGDAVAFPLDGSVAVGVVQWSWVSSTNRVRLEVPLTTLTSPALRDQVIAQVLAISQIGSLTNPGDGIRAGTDHLLAAGREDADWNLCLSTDGITNSGESLSSAVAYAQGSGIDRLSVLALEDPPFFGPADAHAHYGPHVFGGGTVTVARNAPEFASLIIGGCRNPALEVVGFEVNQASQDWVNSVPLVGGKDTVVRAFVQTPDGVDTVRASGRLFAYRNGVELPLSPVSPANRGATVLADNDIASRRSVLADSLNFVIPPAWTFGDVTFELELGGGMSCLESAPPANTCTAEVSFTEAGTLSARFLAVSWRDGDDVRKPTNAQLVEQGRRSLQVMPVVNHSYRYGEFGHVYDEAPATSDVIRTLRRMRRWDCFLSWRDCEDYYYGVIDGQGGGRGYRPGNASAGYLSGTGGRTDGGNVRNRVGHELYHNLGRYHTVDGTLPRVDDRKVGHCRDEDAAEAAPDYPYYFDIGGQMRAALGPMLQDGTDAARDSEIWGVDTRFVRSLPRLGLIDPYTTYALMSYCLPTDASGQGRWVSEFTYAAVRDHFAAAGMQSADAGENPLIMVSGRVHFDTDEVTFDPVLPLPPGAPDPVTPGDYVLELQDAQGAVLHSVAFELDELEADDTEGDALPVGDFLIETVDPGVDLARILVRHDGEVLGTLESGPGTPSVTVTAPAAGDVLDGDRVTLAWSGSDPDGDPLTYSVAYSADDGALWEALAIDLPDETLELDRFWLTPSDEARIMVIASDGIRSAAAVSERFSVAPSVPDVFIDAPEDGEVYFGVQPVSFAAEAVDAGGLSLDAITWTSDVDGTLGAGPSVYLLATDLSEGEHTVTATATGASGLEGSASVTITIGRVAPPPDDDPDQTPLGQLDDLIVLIEGFGLHDGIERSLLAKLVTARNALERDQIDPACHRLQAFANEVQAQAGKHLSDTQAIEASMRAESLRDALGCADD